MFGDIYHSEPREASPLAERTAEAADVHHSRRGSAEPFAAASTRAMKLREQSSDMTGHSFLFVDDDPFFGSLMRSFAAEAYPGAHVVSLDSASTIVDVCARHAFKCVVLDYNMPGVSGLKAATELRRAFPYLPIVMVTAAGDETLAASALKNGINDYIPKSRLSPLVMRQVFEHAIETMSLKSSIDARRVDLERELVDSDHANKVLVRSNKMLRVNEAALDALVKQRTAELQAEIDTRRVMATAIAHELNQPLIALLNYLNGTIRLAESGDVTPATMEIIADASRRAAAQASRAGDLMRLLRNSIVRDDSIWTVEDIGTIADEVIATSAAANEGLDIKFKLERATTETTAQVSRPQIRMILANLIQNAVDAVSGTDHRDVTITVVADTRPEHLRVDVADSGAGVPPEQLEKLFVPFVSNKPHGMGIGLAISREMIEQNNGSIATRPNPLGGAIFSIVLPLHKAT